MTTDQAPTAENDAPLRRARCTAFPLDTVCVASDPCPVHGCDDTDDGSTAQGCYCDPERVTSPGSPAMLEEDQ